jgi:voltage-gated potassium channel
VSDRGPEHPPAQDTDAPTPHPRRLELHRVIFGTDTPAGRAFDVALIALVLASLVVVSMETVRGLQPASYRALRALEWTLTILFTAEYLLRVAAVARPLSYAVSFFGLVDLLAILPTYISLLVPGAQVLLVVRGLRLLRVFRVLKLTRFLSEARTLGAALRASVRKIAVFLLVVLTLVMVVGSLMYVIEGAEHGFTSIPTSVYWAVVTLTTVGYGDISPATPLGRALAALVMIAGYGIIAVPTGIVTAELTQQPRSDRDVRGAPAGEAAVDAPALEAAAAAAPGAAVPSAAVPSAAAAGAGGTCGGCGAGAHAPDARFCRCCGTVLRPAGAPAPVRARVEP